MSLQLSGKKVNRGKEIMIREDAYYPGRRDERWTEPFVGSEITREVISIYHCSDFPIREFKRQRICCWYFFPNKINENIYGEPEHIYEIVLPPFTRIDFYGNGMEARIDLDNPKIRIYELQIK